MMQERHDVFVGNLTFNVTEDQLKEVFRFVGREFFLITFSISFFIINSGFYCYLIRSC